MYARFKLVDEFCEGGDEEMVVRKRQVKARLLYFRAGDLYQHYYLLLPNTITYEY